MEMEKDGKMCKLTVQRSMDNIFHVAQLAHWEYPIQPKDNIHEDRYQAQPYC